MFISKISSIFALCFLSWENMAQHNELGKYGEDLAAKMYEKKGCKILDRNWGIGDLEIDIIAQDKKEIVFCEVKTRSSNRWGEPEDAVDEHRKRRLTVAANAYIKYKRLDNPWRFDVVSIIVENGEVKLRHIEEAFQARARYITENSYKPENNWHKGRFTQR